MPPSMKACDQDILTQCNNPHALALLQAPLANIQVNELSFAPYALL
jgi:hypothetical protein